MSGVGFYGGNVDLSFLELIVYDGGLFIPCRLSGISTTTVEGAGAHLHAN